MSETCKLSRRGFIKVAGMAAGVAAVGLPFGSRAAAEELDFVGQRQQQVYKADAKVYKIRKSQENPMVKKIYDPKTGFLKEGIGGHKAHHLLHTHYVDRSAKIKALKAKGIELALN